VILDANVVAGLTVAVTPRSYVRVTPMAHAATPLGAGYGVTRFASPTKTFKVIYLAQDLTTAIAETLIRDRFQGRVRRKLLDGEAVLWGATNESFLGVINECHAATSAMASRRVVPMPPLRYAASTAGRPGLRSTPVS
jgi:hypothetical protein